MKILFCNIAYMNNYVGDIEKDMPHGGGLYVKKHNDAYEKWNFLNYNGECFGYMQIQGEELHIERIEGVKKADEEAKDVLVVFSANKKNGETVIVGWYEHATVYRYLHETAYAHITGCVQRKYFIEANADDCYLMPEDKRSFKIPRSSIEGKGKGMGRSGVWYAESEYARNELIGKVLDYIGENRQYRINAVNSCFDRPKNVAVPLTDKEGALANSYWEESEFFKFLPLGYRIYEETKNPDSLYFIAVALMETHQFKKSIEAYKKLAEIEGETWDSNSFLPFLYFLCGEDEMAIESAKKLFKFKESQENYTKMVIYSIIIDSNVNLGNIEESIKWLDKVIKETEDDDQRLFSIDMKEDLLNQ